MPTFKIESGDIPAKVNSQLLQEEIATALSLNPSDVALEIVLGTLTIVHSSPLGTREEQIPPFINITVPDGTVTDRLASVIAAHAPEYNDSEDIAAKNAEVLKEQLKTLATDPEMVALIKAAVDS